MTTPANDEPRSEEPQEANGGIGAGTLATVGLALIALAILGWFLYPRFTGTPEEPVAQVASPTLLIPLITATPKPVTATPPPVPTTVAVQPAVTATTAPLPTKAPTIPTKVTSGAYVRVAGTGNFGLRMRSGPGMDFVTWRILPEGEVLLVTGGPREADGFVWWRVVDQSGLVGWAVEQYLVPTKPPAWTPQPERTPVLPTATPAGG